MKTSRTSRSCYAPTWKMPVIRPPWPGTAWQPWPCFGDQPFDLVLLDLMLPKIDGFGVCELIRQQSQVPILMLTALDGEEQQLRGFGMDIDDYVTKPFSMPVLLEKIRVILRRSAGTRRRTAACATGI